MRERSAGVWELIVPAGLDPVTGRRRGIAASVEQLYADWIVGASP
jgi:hypothetical protein